MRLEHRFDMPLFRVELLDDLFRIAQALIHLLDFPVDRLDSGRNGVEELLLLLDLHVLLDDLDEELYVLLDGRHRSSFLKKRMLPTREAFAQSRNEEPACAIPIPPVFLNTFDQSKHSCPARRAPVESYNETRILQEYERAVKNFSSEKGNRASYAFGPSRAPARAITDHPIPAGSEAP